jgi:dihydroflavonol-4-reductase
LGVAEPKNADVLIVPAREGAKRAVKAALKAGVKRVVLTSSTAATSLGANAPDYVAYESVWTDVKKPGVSAYYQSKTLAERTAWALVIAAGDASRLATVNPTAVLGPVLSDDFSGSIQLVQRLLTGKVPGIPRLGFNMVDVRDVADMHIRAMTAPEAGGQRFIASGAFAWMGDLAAILRDNLGARASKVPTRKVPDFVLRLAALFDKDLTAVTPQRGKKHEYSSAKAQRLLGWKPRALKDTVLDCANSLITVGAT